MDDKISITEAAHILGVHPQTLRVWDKEGRLTSYRTGGGHRRYDRDEVKRLAEKTSSDKPKEKDLPKMTVGYCRVSTQKQKKDLERQELVISRYCEANGIQFKIISDIGSGLNYSRRGLLEVLAMVKEEKISRILVNYKDRLARFGYEMIEEICRLHDVEIQILNQTDEISSEQELVDDVLSVITVYSAKLYGKRSHRNQKIIETNQELFIKGGENHGEEETKGTEGPETENSEAGHTEMREDVQQEAGTGRTGTAGTDIWPV